MTLCTVFKCINKHGKVQILNTYNSNITLFIHANAKDLGVVVMVGVVKHVNHVSGEGLIQYIQ